MKDIQVYTVRLRQWHPGLVSLSQVCKINVYYLTLIK